LAQIENSIAKEPKILPTQLKQRSLTGNQEISKKKYFKTPHLVSICCVSKKPFKGKLDLPPS
jgi:hypothetical protein